MAGSVGARRSSANRRFSARFDEPKAREGRGGHRELTQGTDRKRKGLGGGRPRETAAAALCTSSALMREQKNTVEGKRRGSESLSPQPEARQALEFVNTTTEGEFHGGGS